MERILALYERPEVLLEMREACVRHVATHHDPATQGRKLRQIYEAAT